MATVETRSHAVFGNMIRLKIWEFNAESQRCAERHGSTMIRDLAYA